MTNEELLDKIKVEIERLKGIGGIVPLDNREQKTGYESALIDIEIFLDSLESEKPAQEGLEEELDRFIASGKSVTVDDYGTYKVSYHDFKKVARHFAKWGKEYGYREGFLEGARTQREEDDQYVATIYQQDIEKGKDDMKEQITHETVEGEYDQYPTAIYLPAPIPRMNQGDKVKIIIVKE